MKRGRVLGRDSREENETIRKEETVPRINPVMEKRKTKKAKEAEETFPKKRFAKWKKKNKKRT